MRNPFHRMLVVTWTALLLTLAVMAMNIEGKEADALPFALQIESDGCRETVSVWKNEEGIGIVFLPDYADLARTSICLNTASPVVLDSICLTNGMNCSRFQTDCLYEITYRFFGKELRSQMMFVQSSGMAAMYVDTHSGTMDRIHQQKGNAETARIRLYASDGRLVYTGEALSFEGHGNGTWKAPSDKKPYDFTLAQEADLLQMGAAQKWVLLTSFYDPTHLRNKIMLDFAHAAGLPYTPDSEWVHLYLNGEYAGLYLLCEKVESHPQRVTITDDDGFLVSMEFEDRLSQQDLPHIVTQRQQAFRIHTPDQPDETDKQRIASALQSVENAILSENGIDPLTGKHWTALIDLDSWVRKYLVEEISANLDACFLSQYFYLADGRLFAGPVWDMDMALGASWEVADPCTLYANRYHVRGEKNTPWFHALYQQEAFYQRATEIYKNEMLPLLQKWRDEIIPAYIRQIAASAAMNEMRWHDAKAAAETQKLQAFWEKRIAFLSDIWLEENAYAAVVLDPRTGGYYGYRMTPAGTPPKNLPELPDSKDQRFAGWYRADTHQPFDPSAPIAENMSLYAVWEDTAYKRLRHLAALTPLGLIGLSGLAFLIIDLRRNTGKG